jgi:hypothetical protein
MSHPPCPPPPTNTLELRPVRSYGQFSARLFPKEEFPFNRPLDSPCPPNLSLRLSVPQSVTSLALSTTKTHPPCPSPPKNTLEHRPVRSYGQIFDSAGGKRSLLCRLRPPRPQASSNNNNNSEPEPPPQPVSQLPVWHDDPSSLPLTHHHPRISKSSDLRNYDQLLGRFVNREVFFYLVSERILATPSQCPVVLLHCPLRRFRITLICATPAPRPRLSEPEPRPWNTH